MEFDGSKDRDLSVEGRLSFFGFFQGALMIFPETYKGSQRYLEGGKVRKTRNK